MEKKSSLLIDFVIATIHVAKHSMDVVNTVRMHMYFNFSILLHYIFHNSENANEVNQI
jgi:hypothetical protein